MITWMSVFVRRLGKSLSVQAALVFGSLCPSHVAIWYAAQLTNPLHYEQDHVSSAWNLCHG